MHKNSTLTTQELELIKTMASQGKKFNEIANAINNKVSRQRIQQIVAKAGIDSFAIRRAEQIKTYEERMFKKWGKEWHNKEFRKSAIYHAMREKFFKKKTNAAKHGFEFSIDFCDLEFPTHCPILGIELDYFVDYRAENSVSFDRIDPSKDYVKGNVIIVSWRANRIKNDGTADEHQKIADFMSRYGL